MGSVGGAPRGCRGVFEGQRAVDPGNKHGRGEHSGIGQYLDIDIDHAGEHFNDHFNDHRINDRRIHDKLDDSGRPGGQGRLHVVCCWVLGLPPRSQCV